MAKNKVKDKESNCELCAIFFSLPSNSLGRHCPELQKHVFNDSKSCDNFILAKHFYCTKRHIQISSVSCVAIRQTKRNGTDGKVIPAKYYKDVFSMCAENCPDGQLIEALTKPKSILKRRTKITLKRRNK